MLVIERNIMKNEGVRIGKDIIISFAPAKRGNTIKIGVTCNKSLLVERVMEVLDGDIRTGIWVREDHNGTEIRKCIQKKSEEQT